MAFNRVNTRNLLFTFTILSLFTLSLQDAAHTDKKMKKPPHPAAAPLKPLQKGPPHAPLKPGKKTPLHHDHAPLKPGKKSPPHHDHAPHKHVHSNQTTKKPLKTHGGSWELLQKSVGVAAMHMQLLHTNQIVIFDRTDFGPSNLTLPPGKCRLAADNTLDCTSHSLLYDIPTNTYRPLFVQTNTWCSSGSVHPDGTLVQTGGYAAGEKNIRLFKPCIGKEQCDWIQHPEDLSVRRWYATNQILPDGRVIIVGGELSPSYEFFPKDPINKANLGHYDLPFLKETTDQPEPNNLYPFVYLMPDGNLYIFANQRSILFDYINNRVIKEYPRIPGNIIRSYPCTASSVLLPVKLTPANKFPELEIVICGGTKREAPLVSKNPPRKFLPASKSCARMKITDPKAKWTMEEMPIPRTIPDMITLPSGDILILNGAMRGAAGWEMGEQPALNPVLYKPNNEHNKRFVVQKAATRPRMYHSTATLLPDGRVLVGGSNPHEKNDFKAKFPTDMSLEAFVPEYMNPRNNKFRPTVDQVETKDNIVIYGQKFQIKFSLGSKPAKNLKVVLVYPAFATHSVGMNQRVLVLAIQDVKPAANHTYQVTAEAPATANVAPPGYYMLFVVNAGIPSHSVWVKVNNV